MIFWVTDRNRSSSSTTGPACSAPSRNRAAWCGWSSRTKVDNAIIDDVAS